MEQVQDPRGRGAYATGSHYQSTGEDISVCCSELQTVQIHDVLPLFAATSCKCPMNLVTKPVRRALLTCDRIL
jgi:3-deoxy-D-arabino-heptulosonate 7-phosphate (DAHP) synthase class II